MSRRVVILSTAEDDLDAGAQFYETQAEGLGDHFLTALRADLLALGIHGGSHRRQHGYHRAIARHFPYAIFYRVEGTSVAVRAVLDCRRDPREIRRRLRRT